MKLEKLLFLDYNMNPYSFTNSYPLSHNRNIDFTGSSRTNPYLLIQQAGKKRKTKRKTKRRTKRKTCCKKIDKYLKNLFM